MELADFYLKLDSNSESSEDNEADVPDSVITKNWRTHTSWRMAWWNIKWVPLLGKPLRVPKVCFNDTWGHLYFSTTSFSCHLHHSEPQIQAQKGWMMWGSALGCRFPKASPIGPFWPPRVQHSVHCDPGTECLGDVLYLHPVRIRPGEGATEQSLSSWHLQN